MNLSKASTLHSFLLNFILQIFRLNIPIEFRSKERKITFFIWKIKGKRKLDSFSGETKIRKKLEDKSVTFGIIVAMSSWSIEYKIVITSGKLEFQVNEMDKQKCESRLKFCA